MRAILLAALALLTTVPATADEPQAAVVQPTAPQVDPSAAPPAAELAAAADAPKAAEPDEIYLPAGFKEKKRGKFTLYCRKEDVMGTRFPVEKCYDEKGIREYLLDQRENQKQVDQMRRICGSMESCGGGG